MTTLRPVSVITGASAGIGVALAWIFARHGHELVLVARREERLRALAGEIAAAGHVKPLVIAADLQRSDAGRLITDKLTAFGVEPQYMVNNAGYGLAGLAGARPRDEELGMIDVNMRALTGLSLAFIDSLERRKGGILNVGSVAGFLPGPGMAIYYASKAYVLSFSEALHSELKPRGVRVTVLCPGPVATEFAAVAGVASGLAPPILSQSAEQVAEQGYRGLMRGQRVVIPGFANRLAVFLIGLTPRRVLLALVEARQSRRRSAPGT